MGIVDPSTGGGEEPDPVCPDWTNELTSANLQVGQLEAELDANDDELKTLSDGRCTANMLFVEALKEHRLGIEILAELQ